MASKLQESVAGFKMEGDMEGESAITGSDGYASGVDRNTATEITDTASDSADHPASDAANRPARGETPLA